MNYPDYDKWKLNPPERVDEDDEAWEGDEWVKQQKEKLDGLSDSAETKDS